MDYPYYEELCRRKHPAAWWWIIGDRLYYLGLIPALLALSGVPVALLLAILDHGWHWLIMALTTFIGGGAIFVLGNFLKNHAYALGERDGISEVEVYKRHTGNASSAAESDPSTRKDFTPPDRHPSSP
jgi:hypothetical protein